MMFFNPTLAEEAKDIYKHTHPDHYVYFSIILHLKDKDIYPDNLSILEVTHDYDGSLTDETTLSMDVALGDFNHFIYKNRDEMRVTLVISYNGLKRKQLTKAVLLTNPNQVSLGLLNNAYTDSERNQLGRLPVTIQLVNPLFSLLKNITINGIVPNTTVEDIIRYTLATEVGKIELDGERLIPVIDLHKPHNPRLYHNVIMNDRIRLLDLPLFLQTHYGVYNGGMCTYIYNNGEKDVVAIGPLYNPDEVPEIRTMQLYLSDTAIVPDVSNKTVILDGTKLRIIGTTTGSLDDSGGVLDFEHAKGFKSQNSNQVMDRVYDKRDGKVYADASKVIDSQQDQDSVYDLASLSFNDNNDNLYAVRSVNLRNKLSMLNVQWNCSRPDYLVPMMGVELIYVYEGRVRRRMGVLMSHHSRYDNAKKNCNTILNVLVE